MVSPEVKGVDMVQRRDVEPALLMKTRLCAFADLDLTHPAMYLDTDMLCVKPLDPHKILGDFEVAACARDYDRNALVNPEFPGMDLSCYAGRTKVDVWPYV